MKKILVLLSTALFLLVFSFACKKKETCKQCGWYDKTNNTLVGTLESKCGDAIATFEAQSEMSYTASTATVKSVLTKVPKCQ